MIAAIIYGIHKLFGSPAFEIEYPPHRLQNINNLRSLDEKRQRAKQLRLEGKYMSALQEFQELLISDLKAYGPTDAKIISDYINISNLYEYLHNYNKALEYQNQALDALRQIHNTMHPSVAIVLSDIARLNSKLGNNEEGLKHATQAYNILCQFLGSNHPEVLVTLNDMGDINYRLHQYEEALKIYDQLLNLYIEKEAENQRLVAVCLNKKGSVYLEIKEFDQAIQHFDRAYGILKDVYKSHNHPELSIILDDMALAYEVSGDKDKALEIYHQALVINEEFAQDRPEAKLNSFNQIGRLYSRMGNHDQAIEYFEKALKFAKANFAIDPSIIASEYSILAICYERMNNLDKALEYISKALEIETQKGGESKEVALSLSHKGRFLALKGSLDEGLELCNNALEIIVRIDPSNIAETGRIYHDIGRCYILKEDIKVAHGFLQKSKKLLEKTHGSDELFLGFCLKDVAEVEFKLGNKVKARELLKNAFKIFKYFLGKDNQVVQDSIRLGEEWEKNALIEKSHTKMD